ncbi:hypothetical protein CQ018_17625 [Arthrobacter sp. MYb227]|nr:hypothetical protein [Arthrobacter sp. MYb227]PQZ87762.1 hypothetical protein CQ018_17625 [Arthrobacter sp. MYb227]
MFDSEFSGVRFLHCGYFVGAEENAVLTGNFETGYGYSLVLGRYLDQSNANKFINCHFEGGPLFVETLDYSRQNNFTGYKFENRTPVEDSTSGKSAISLGMGLETQFLNCMFTENYSRPEHFVNAQTTDNSYIVENNIRQANMFSNCLFFASTKATAGALYFNGHTPNSMGANSSAVTVPHMDSDWGPSTRSSEPQ